MTATPTDDRGAAALIGVVNRLALGSDICAMPVADLATAVLGERGRFLPDGRPSAAELMAMPDDMFARHIGALRSWESELARLRQIETAARDVQTLCDCPSDWLMQDGSHDHACIQRLPVIAALRTALDREP